MELFNVGWLVCIVTKACEASRSDNGLSNFYSSQIREEALSRERCLTF